MIVKVKKIGSGKPEDPFRPDISNLEIKPNSSIVLRKDLGKEMEIEIIEPKESIEDRLNKLEQKINLIVSALKATGVKIEKAQEQ